MVRVVGEEHERLRVAMCEQHYEMERQHSLKLQESMFLHKQEYQQLRYEYEVLRAKEDTLKAPVKSEIVYQSEEDSKEEWGRERERLEGVLREREREAEEFQHKVMELERDAGEVRESNNKLYECIFDLEQKVAFHKEEADKMEGRLRERIGEEYSREMEQHTMRRE